jgi:hypothetical protein
MLTTLLTSCADSHEFWEPETPGTHRACPGLYRNCFEFIWIFDGGVAVGMKIYLMRGFEYFRHVITTIM